MKRTIYISATLALLLGLAACNSQENPYNDGSLPEGEYPVVIRATGLSAAATPASRATVDGDWEGVTSVAVMIDGTMKEYNVAASADNTSATLSNSDDSHYWISRDPITVTAWWPYTAGETTLPDVVVNEDQSTQEAFAASDFISAENRTVEFSDPTLTFTHRTARVALVLTPGSGITSVDDATVSLTNLSTANGNPVTIQPRNTTGNTFEALIVPQTVAAGNTFIQVGLNDGTFYVTPQDNVVFEAGNRYTFTVKVNATGLTLEGCIISAWSEGKGEDGQAAEEYSYNEKTNTYKVFNTNGLLAWAEAAQKDRTLNCILAANIDLTEEWTPIGDDRNPYTGTFEGNGKTISGLTIEQSTTSHLGLIGCLGTEGKVQNLTLKDVNICGNNSVGSVVGDNYGTVTGCTFSGSVSGNNYAGGNYVGGNYIGGVAGYNYGSVIACTSLGEVKGYDGYSIGGVTGENRGVVIACTATGSVSGAQSVGGVAGYNTIFGSVIACYHATGTVYGSSNIGGVVGENATGSPVTDCYWSDYVGDGIGNDATGTGTTQVTDGNWTSAVGSMNNTIETWNAGNYDNPCNWRYEIIDGHTLPTLKKIE